MVWINDPCLSTDGYPCINIAAMADLTDGKFFQKIKYLPEDRELLLDPLMQSLLTNKKHSIQ
jgi:hypothetical protein